MWEEVEKDVLEIDQIEGTVQKSLKTSATSKESESKSSPTLVTTTASIIDSIDRVGQRDKLLSYAVSIEKKISVLEEDLKKSTLNRSYISMVQPKLKSYARKMTSLVNQLKAMDMSDDSQFSILPLVSMGYYINV